MSREPIGIRRVTLLVAAAFSVSPAALYWQFVGRVPSVTPEAAKEELARPGASAALVDVRTAEEFKARHLEAAENWPYAEIAIAQSREDVPERLRGKRLLLLCESGILSAAAAERLRALGLGDAVNVEGGLQTWIAAAEKPCAQGLCTLRLASGRTAGMPFRESSPAEEWAIVLTGFGVKPFYTVLSLALVILLWRQRSPDLAALRWAMLSFFVGENFCAANYLVFGDRSCLCEYLHSLGMVLCFGLSAFALVEAADRRLVKFSDPEARCAAAGLCRRCAKHADAPCGLRRTFLFLLPALMLLCGVPLLADFITVSYNTEILGTFYNFSHPVLYQIYEIRYCPAAALTLLGVSLAVLALKRRDPVAWSKVFFAAGVGALGFSFFRLVFVQVYRDDLAWFTFWEETTEAIFLLGVGLLLWLFRHGLFAETAR